MERMNDFIAYVAALKPVTGLQLGVLLISGLLAVVLAAIWTGCVLRALDRREISRAKDGSK